MSKSSSGMTRYTLDLDNAQHKELRLRALQEDRPVSELCRELIATYLSDAAAHDDARLRAAYEAGARAERERIVASALCPPENRRPGLPTQPPTARD